MLWIINRKNLNGKEAMNMKKMFFVFLASLAMSACVQEKFDTSADAPAVASFEASREAFGGVSTRTVLADGCRVEWVKGDAVAVFDGKGTYIFKADKSGSKAIFETTDEAFDASADGYMFVYPYVEDCVVDASKVQFYLAAEQKARVTYDNILRLSDDPDVNDVIRFLRQREVVHFQRFGDVLRKTQEGLDQKNYYSFNPEYTKKR